MSSDWDDPEPKKKHQQAHMIPTLKTEADSGWTNGIVA